MTGPFDVIVVGAGAAGAVLAARLTEDPSCRVLLLEAGADWRTADRPPEMASTNPFNLLLPDHFQQKYLYADLMARRTARQSPRLYWRGKGVGGSTSVNGVIAIRGLLSAFDEWAEIGCEGWSGAQVLPYFNRLESDPLAADVPGADVHGAHFHGADGPIPVYRAPVASWGPVDRALREAALGLGHPWCDDLNAPDAEGVCTYAINARGGRRVSANDAYLEPARSRPNLTILGDSTVDRVIFDGTRATHVRVARPDGVRDVAAPLIVLSAGTIHSPAILQRSGVGPAALLRPLGIGMVADLPVGDGFFDHPFVRLELKLRPELRATDPEARHTNCCLKFSSGLPGAPACDLLMISFNHGGVGVQQDMAQFGEAGLHANLMEARSRGTVRIDSPDPRRQPVVDENMLDHPFDRERMRLATRHLGRMAQQEAFQSICTDIQLGNSGRPLDELFGFDDDALDDWMLENCSDSQHGTGGCCMGLRDAADGRSVVDPDCRVRGLQGLRVIDASIMPLDCQANTNFSTMMIGEKMADQLKGDLAAGRAA